MKRVLVVAVALIFAVVVPLPLDEYMRDVLVQALTAALFATGLNVVVGLAGLLDLGYVAFLAIGAYTLAIFSGVGPVDVGPLPIWAIIPLAIVLATAAGVALGFPVLRLRGDYLAIVTLGFGEIIRVAASNLDSITGGAKGISRIPHPVIFGFEFGLKTLPYYYLTLFALVIAVVVVFNLKRSRVGRAWAAIKQDEPAAEAMGVNALRMKLWAFAIGASMAGVAGVINSSKSNLVSPGSFLIIQSFLVLAMVVLGGQGSIIGPIVGALVIIIVPEMLRDFVPIELRYATFGAILVVMMIFRPQGIFPQKRRARGTA